MNLAPQMQGFPRLTGINALILQEASILFPSPCYASELSSSLDMTVISFVAIDFETANHSRDSACAVGLTAVRRGRIEVTQSFLIRPPESQFVFTWVHGLRWEDVRASPTFGELWPTLQSWIDNAEFIAAHNAPFDRSILRACCGKYGIRVPQVPFTCTVQLARSQWGIYPTRLPDVCRRLRIPLRHHDAESDAEACARIVLAAQAEGWQRRQQFP